MFYDKLHTLAHDHVFDVLTILSEMKISSHNHQLHIYVEFQSVFAHEFSIFLLWEKIFHNLEANKYMELNCQPKFVVLQLKFGLYEHGTCVFSNVISL